MLQSLSDTLSDQTQGDAILVLHVWVEATLDVYAHAASFANGHFGGRHDNDDDNDDGPPSTAVIPSVPIPSKLVSMHISINPQHGLRFATSSRSLTLILSNVWNPWP
jgi:hypothetical protein